MPPTMDYLQKAEILNALTPITLGIRSVNNWYVSQQVGIFDGVGISGGCGNGLTPEDAINDHWRKYVDKIPEGKKLIVTNKQPLKTFSWNDKKLIEPLTTFSWNGYRWVEGERVSGNH